jgi:methionyl-tRNA formyltransferase
MNITLLTNKDLASNVALNYLYRAIGQEHKLRVFLSAQVGAESKQGTKAKALQDLAFIEQSLFNDVLFPALGLREKRAQGKLSTFDEFAQEGVSVEEISSINCEQGVKTIKAGSPDLIISIRFGLILKGPVLKIAPYGVINLHSGMLPNYRGVMACFRAMHNGDKYIASTLHYICDGSIDTGNVISHYKMPLDYHASYLANVLALYKGGVESIVDAIKQIHAQGVAESQPQSPAGNYYSFPTEGDLQAFRDKGLRLFDHDDVRVFSKLYF